MEMLKKLENNNKIVQLPLVTNKPLHLVTKVKKPKEHYIQIRNSIVLSIIEVKQEIKNTFTILDIPIIIYWNRIEESENPCLFDLSKLIGYAPSFIKRILKNSQRISLDGDQITLDDSWIDSEIGNKLFDFSLFKYMKLILQKKRKKFLPYYQLLLLYFFNQFTGKTTDKTNFDLTKIIEKMALTEMYNHYSHSVRAKEYIEIGFQLLVDVGMLKSYSISFKTKIVCVEKDERFFTKIKPVKPKRKAKNER